MSKKIISLLLIVFMIAAVGGCGVKDKVTEEITEKVTEGVINNALDGQGKVDIEGGTISIKGEDGGELTIGETKWPETGAAQLIPKFNKGKISSAINSNEICVLSIEEVEKADFDEYVEEVKAQGFTVEPLEYTSQIAASYLANKDENTKIAVQYLFENKMMTINMEISE